MRRLLLFSNSTNHASTYLAHGREELVDFLGAVRRLAFVPFALADRAGYAQLARERLAAFGLEVDEVTPDAAGVARVRGADAVFVGGGNTFRLLDTLQRSAILPVLRERALGGMPYVGSSAGSNIAAPTLKTTNDMPIVEPVSFVALGLIPFQINPHYQDSAPGSTHMGETREERLVQYLEENAAPVVGLREGAWIRIEGGCAILGGSHGARVFRHGEPAQERAPGASLDDLLAAS